MESTDSKEKRLQRKAQRIVKQALDAERTVNRGGIQIVTVIGQKGGLGKTLAARAIIDRYQAAAQPVRIVQIDRTPQLEDLYGNSVSVVHLPSWEESRAEPLAAVTAFEPLADAIDATLRDGAALVIDVGGGPSAAATAEYVGKSRLDAYLQQNNVQSVVFLLLLADPASMSQSIELARALEAVYPSAAIVAVLNERDGKFRFYPGSHADQVWQDKVAPFLFGKKVLHMPALPAGALAPFETIGFTFTSIINATDVDIGKRIGVSRAIAATLQGDVAVWLETLWFALDDILPLDQGDSNG